METINDERMNEWAIAEHRFFKYRSNVLFLWLSFGGGRRKCAVYIFWLLIFHPKTNTTKKSHNCTKTQSLSKTKSHTQRKITSIIFPVITIFR